MQIFYNLSATVLKSDKMIVIWYALQWTSRDKIKRLSTHAIYVYNLSCYRILHWTVLQWARLFLLNTVLITNTCLNVFSVIIINLSQVLWEDEPCVRWSPWCTSTRMRDHLHPPQSMQADRLSTSRKLWTGSRAYSVCIVWTLGFCCGLVLLILPISFSCSFCEL